MELHVHVHSCHPLMPLIIWIGLASSAPSLFIYLRYLPTSFLRLLYIEVITSLVVLLIKTMSGVSFAAPPQSQLHQTDASPSDQGRRQQRSSGNVMGSLRVIELQLVAFIMVFSVTGLVPLLDLLFPAFASAYILALSRLAFPALGCGTKFPEIFQGSRLFRSYVMVGTAVGLFLPLAYVLGGFAKGDNHAVRSATPHLFLLSFQILTENVMSALSLFSAPVRAFVPLLYTARRIVVILDWVNDVWNNKTLQANAEFKDAAWFWFGRGLAVANLAYFSVNLLCFVMPRLLPRAFERYFKERDELKAKMGNSSSTKFLHNKDM